MGCIKLFSNEITDLIDAIVNEQREICFKTHTCLVIMCDVLRIFVN